MTRAAHRILNRARADAWRRVGIPVQWDTPGEGATDTPTAPETPKTPAANADETTGKNVAGPTGGNAGTGQPPSSNGSTNSDEHER